MTEKRLRVWGGGRRHRVLHALRHGLPGGNGVQDILAGKKGFPQSLAWVQLRASVQAGPGCCCLYSLLVFMPPEMLTISNPIILLDIK